MNKTNIVLAVVTVILIGLLVATIIKNNTTHSTAIEESVSNQSIKTETTETASVEQSQMTTPAANTANTGATSAPTVTTGKKMSFSSFIKQGGSYKCAVSEYLDPTYTTTTDGAIHLSDQKVRGDFRITLDNETVDTSFIVRDGFVFTWSTQLPFGIKTVAHETASSGTPGATGWSPDMVKDYQCSPWKAEAALFSVPSNIDFKSY